MGTYFDLWFGGIFFVIGVVALGAALALYLFWPRLRQFRVPHRGIYQGGIDQGGIDQGGIDQGASYQGQGLRFRSRRGATSLWAFMAAPLIVGLVFTLLGGSFVGYGLQRLQVEERLRASGVTLRATVVDIERTNSRVNGRYLWQIRYEYRDSAGRAYEGVSSYLESRDAQSYRIGEQAFIRYDPAEPTTSIWLGRQDHVRAPDSQHAAGNAPTVAALLLAY